MGFSLGWGPGHTVGLAPIITWKCIFSRRTGRGKIAEGMAMEGVDNQRRDWRRYCREKENGSLRGKGRVMSAGRQWPKSSPDLGVCCKGSSPHFKKVEELYHEIL